MEEQIPVSKIISHITSNGLEYSSEIQEWISSSSENKSIYDDYLSVWRVSGNFPKRFSTNKAKAWQKVQKDIQLSRKKFIPFYQIGKIAAALILALLCVWAGSELSIKDQQNQYTEVFSPSGQKTQILLPDSSVILLNGNSKIRYSQNFNGDKRYVELSGEGYFNVHKDPSRQFVVHTNELDVKVLGTSFNVKAYDNDLDVEVGLKSGSVSIGGESKKVILLQPGELATFDKSDKTLHVEKINIDVISAWTKDEMAFNEKSMSEIIKYLERWYGVGIHADSELLNGELYTFKVKTESLNELLKMINLLKPIEYHIDGKEVFINKPK